MVEADVVTSTKAGVVALVGRPNAGKSTLMNQCLAERLAIVSDKPQTTRHRIVGILSEARGQMVFHDTPGLHRPHHRMNRQMVRSAVEALDQADVVCLMVDADKSFGQGDRFVLNLLTRSSSPRVAALNKIDRVSKPSLLPLLARYGDTGLFAEIVPISALTGDGVEILLGVLWDLLPQGRPFYDPELLTIHPERFLAAERIREKLLAETRDELPFSTTVFVDRWQEISDSETGDRLVIYASIIVERRGQKKIVVGKGGEMIKRIGTAARRDLEELLQRPVYLDLRVRHEPAWRENPRLLADLDRELFSNGET